MVAVAPAPTSQEDRPRHLLICVLAYASLVVCTLFNLVIPLIPVLPGELGADASDVSWVATVFFLTGAVANPLAGRMADMFGNRRVFIICIWLLIAGSLVCAVAPDLPTLLVGRVLQGMSLPMMSISLSIMRHQLVIRRLPAAVGTATAAMGIGNGLGLVGGGFLIDTYSWHAVFWATVAVALPLALLAPFIVPADTVRVRQRLDVTGTVVLVGILVCLLLPLSKLADWGLSWGTLSLVVAALVLIPWWSLGRLRHSAPVVDLRPLRSLAITGTHLAAMAAGFTGFLAFIVTTNVLQAPGPDGLDLSLTEAGLCMTPASMSFLAIGPVTSQLVLRLGMRRTLVIGGVVTAVGALGMAIAGTALAGLLGFSFVVFAGNGILLSALPVATAAYSEPAQIGSANGVNALSRTMGIAFASGVFALVLDAVGAGDPHGILTGTHLVSAGVALAMAVLCAVAIPRRPRPPGPDQRLAMPAPPPAQ